MFIAYLVSAPSLSRVQPSVAPWTVTHEAPLSMGFPRQEYWSGLPSPSPAQEYFNYTMVINFIVLMKKSFYQKH